MAVFEALAATAVSRYFFFFGGLVLALILIELRLNLRMLYRHNDDLSYKVILPIMIVPDWALTATQPSKIANTSKGFLRLFKK